MEEFEARLTNVEVKLAGELAESQERWEEFCKQIFQVKTELLDLLEILGLMEASVLRGLKEDIRMLKESRTSTS
jgi:hypothetical protein